MQINSAELNSHKVLFGSSGIRQLMSADLMEIALKVGAAIGKDYVKIVVGCDTRTSSETIKHCLVAGALAAGAQICDVGFVSTPTLAYMAKDYDAGAMITASHNPPDYNGIKLLNSDGSAFDASQRRRVESQAEADSWHTSSWFNIQRENHYNEAVKDHVDHILRHFPVKYGLNVVVDAGCGAAYAATPYLLNKMGCKVIAMNCHSTGIFPHNVEPTEANLTELIQTVGSLGADLGIAHDGDADRMMAVDDKGRFISGDKLLAIFALQSGAKKIVTTVDASMLVDEIGLDVVRTEVGDIYVSEQLKYDGDWGGEPSGSWIFPEHSLCPDGIYAAAAAVSIASRRKLSFLTDELPSYCILRGSFSNEHIDIEKLKDRILTHFNPLLVSRIDGLKLQLNDGWILVRPSGTEPKIRFTVEGRSQGQAQALYDATLAVASDFRLSNTLSSVHTLKTSVAL